MSRSPANAPAEATEDVSLQVMVPPSVRDQLRRRAAQEGSTQRAIILDALRRVGIEVSEAELQDRRRSR